MSNTNKRNLAYLSLGSNIESETNLPAAVKELMQYGEVSAVSSVWETAPYGDPDQNDYLNAAVLLETDLSAAQLRQRAIADIEERLGRVRTSNKFAARPIDIDIILFNNEIFSLGKRQVPNPELLEHAYVAVPIAEIAPDYVHPEINQTLETIADQFDIEIDIKSRREDVKLR